MTTEAVYERPQPEHKDWEPEWLGVVAYKGVTVLMHRYGGDHGQFPYGVCVRGLNELGEQICAKELWHGDSLEEAEVAFREAELRLLRGEFQ